MTTGSGLVAPDPYVVPDASLDDTDPSGTVLETTLVTSLKTVDLGGGLMANTEVYNGAIPGPTFHLNVDDTVIVRLVNDLPYPTGIHWHGIELQNSADGTPVTQDPAAVGPFPQPVGVSPSGGTYLYKFKVPRPGIYWYHPHHFHSTNRVFRGLYGMIVVADPAEGSLPANVLPAAADTLQLVLSDTTVCKAPGANDAATYVDPNTLPAGDAPEWLSGATAQLGPAPVTLCEIPPNGQAMQEDGSPAPASYAVGEIPNIQRNAPGRTVEGQTVLTNGVDVGGRLGTPAAPGALAAGAHQHPVQSGQGIRLQIVNCAHLRYFRLRLTTSDGTQVPLVRIGGEGGLLDRAVREGGVVSGFDTRYDAGEILLPPATRADVVAAIPAGEPVGSVLTLWTRDFPRAGGVNPGNWAQLPTVPVMHLNVTGAAPGAYAIEGGFPGGPQGTPLRADPAVNLPVETLGPANGALLDPSTFVPAKNGMATPITLTAGGGAGINGVQGDFSGFMPYTTAPHIGSSRYAEPGNLLELTVGNESGAHHPFHLHGFSFQPLSLTPGPGAPGGSPSYTWSYQEFRDTVNIPRNYVLTFRVRLDDRELADGVTMGGAFGRWLFHCHIFFHAHSGMISELVVTSADGSEKPNVDVGGSWAYTPVGGTATRKGTFSHPDGDLMTLTASKGTVMPPGPAAGGPWTWTYNSPPGESPSTEYVYVTAEEDPAGRKDQAVFRLKVGAPDDGSDSGDPHIRTVDGKKYDLQSAGELVLLRDRDGMEIQTRQTPVPTQNPITDSYSGLKACVSVNTAVAARVGSHRIAYQPGPEPGELQFYLNGKPTRLPREGHVLDGHRVSAFDANGATGLRIDYAHHAVVVVTPRFWNGHGIWYMNVSISHTQGDEGLMGPIPKGSWLPRLADGATLGPMPESLHDRWVELYRTFADSWRVTDRTSLFVYAPGTSTADFTDRDWPAEEPPCELKPGFELPGPVPAGLPVEEAERICQAVTVDDLHRDCVFDVATTGDEVFAEGYRIAQDLRLHGTSVHVVADPPRTRQGEPVRITASVLPFGSGRPSPTGTITFLVNGVAIGAPVSLDGQGQAQTTLERLEVGESRIRAVYTPGGAQSEYHEGTSLDLLHSVEEGPAASAGPGSWKKSLWLWLLILAILILLLAYWL